MSEIIRLFNYLKPYKAKVVMAFIALFLTAISILIFGKVARFFIDHGLENKNNLNNFLLIFVFLVFILAVSGYLRSKIINSICQKISFDLKSDIYRNLISLSANFFNNNKIGDIISRISSDIDSIVNILSGNFAFFLRNLILFCGGLLFLFITNFKLTIITLSFIFCALLPLLFFSRKIKKLSSDVSESNSLLLSQVEENFNSIKLIQSLAIEDKIIASFDEINQNSLKNNLAKIKIKSFLIAVTIFFAFLSIALMLYIGAYDIQSNKITSGQLSSFIFYGVITSVSLVGLSQVHSQIESLKTSLTRVFELIDKKSEIESVKYSDFKSEKIDLSFVDVDFSYPKSDKKILNKFNLKIKDQQKIFVYGQSGSGKSTLINLLLRFYDVNSGDIFLNKTAINKISLKNLRSLFSFSSQENLIFSASIRENLIIANDEISNDELQNIIDSNKVFAFINDFSEGLETKIGEKGSKLSGGQKQRISILRSLLKPAKIIIMDEPTSLLDQENEDDLYDFVNNFCQNKTLIIISHKKPKSIKFDQEIKIS